MSQIHCIEVLKSSAVIHRNTNSFFCHFCRYFDRHKKRFLNGRCPEWSAANDIRDIVHGVRPDLRLSGRSIFSTMDYDLGRGPLEWHNTDRLVHANVFIFHGIPSISRCWRGIVQHHCTDHHIGFICQRYPLKNAGHVLLCHTSWFGLWVSRTLQIALKSCLPFRSEI